MTKNEPERRSGHGLDKAQSQQVVGHLNEDERHDLLMYLAEEFNVRVLDSEGKDVTYFLCTDHRIFDKFGV